jgi:glutathione S-transferase
MTLVDEQNAHRAAVEAGYASLPGYLETWPATDREWARNHVAIAERHAAAGPRWVGDVPPVAPDVAHVGLHDLSLMPSVQIQKRCFMYCGPERCDCQR